MSYIVVYQRTDGSAGVEECGDLDLAIVTAERLRNVDSVERPRIFKTEEITYDFRPYYRVEVTTDAADTVETSGAASIAGATAVAPTTPLRDVASESTSVPMADPFATEEGPNPLASEALEPPTPPPPPIPQSLTESPESSESSESSSESSNVTALSEAAANAHSASENLTDTTATAASSGGLFSTEVSDDASMVADLEGDVTEVEPDPPRRGLFGR